MISRWLRPLLIVATLVVLFAFTMSIPAYAGVNPQQPTIAVPTVTGTPIGVTIIVKMDTEQINVRAGPSTVYEKVGVLLAGQEVPARGRSVTGEWILVVYPGAQGGVAWVYAPLVDIKGGALPVVEPPPTPTPAVTNTIDPTLAAQFIVTSVPTRLPTFTPPPPLAIPSFAAPSSASAPGGIPMGLVIVALAALGAFLGLFSLIQGR
jgi:hypothetical protein